MKLSGAVLLWKLKRQGFVAVFGVFVLPVRYQSQDMGLGFNLFTAFFVAIGSFLFGYDSGIISSVLTFETFNTKFGLNASLTGAVNSTFTGGCFFGAAFGGWSSDRIGRKRSTQIGAVLALWGCAMQGGANNYATLLIGRIVGGLAIGLLSMTVPLYNTEIAPPKIRGFMVGLTQQMLGIGFIVANWIGYGCQYLNGDAQWRLPLSLQMVPALLLLIGINFLPYSPRWLIEVGRDDEARQVVHMLYGSTPEAQEAAEAEYITMAEAIKAELLTKSHNVADLWATKAMMHRTLVSAGVQIFGQFTGINVINYYGPKMYESLGLNASQSLLVQGIYGAVGPITNFFFITLVLDTVGRRRPLLYGAGSFVVTFSILAAIVASFPPGAGITNFAAQRAGIAMIFLTSINFSLSFGPVSWVLASEVYPTRIRSIGTAVATCSNWAFNCMLSQVSPIAMDNIGYKFYIVFICLNTFDFLVIFFTFPETKGKTLEQMAEVFGDQIDAHAALEHVQAEQTGDKQDYDHRD